MKLSVWHPALVTWLNQQVTVDSWLLQQPKEIGKVSGFVPPLRNLKYWQQDHLTVNASGLQEFYLCFRYSKDLQYSELPMHTLEGIYQTLSIRLVHSYRAIAELIDLEWVAQDDPIKLKESGAIGPNRGADWLVELGWSFQITWEAEPETGTTQQPFDLSSLEVNIWRSDLSDFQDKVKDYTLRLP